MLFDQAHSASIRLLDVNRDLDQVADLIEQCFASSMDEEGRNYISHLRRAARDASLRRWAQGANERISLPISGYVWEEGGRVVGNLSLIPFHRQGKWRTMIANVAVHPQWRRKGIARALTQKALRHIREHQVNEAWLQVREDNPAAQALYRSLGFRQRCVRSTWELRSREATQPRLAQVQVAGCRARDWPYQQAWLKRIYPPEVAWNLDFDPARIRPNLLNMVLHWLSGDTLLQWSARQEGSLLGFVTWEVPVHAQGALWLAPNPQVEHQALLALLGAARRGLPASRALSVNYPAGQSAAAFTQAGFTLLNTLIWMSVDLL